MARELSDWLTTYLEYTKGSEPPTSYHTWCGLAVIAGALQRKVYLRMGFEQIYPNIYAILVGPSGRTRKGVALGIAKAILQKVPGISVAPESSSGREAMVVAMKRAIGNFQDSADGKIKFHCSITAFSEELSVFLGQGDVKYLANLTDWYDSKDTWEYETIGRGKDSLQGLCFTLAGGTAPDWLQSMLPQEAVGGGFTARVIFIVEERKKQTVPEHILTPEDIALEEVLVRDLERLSQLSGEVQFTTEGKMAYTQWYAEQDARLNAGQPAVDDARFAAYCERRATHLRKLMMLCSASRGDSLLIDLPDFDRARDILVDAERSMHKTFGGLGKARYGDSQEKVMNYIKAVGITTRAALLAKFYRDIDAPTLKVLEETMQHMGVITVKYMQNGDKAYTWVGK